MEPLSESEKHVIENLGSHTDNLWLSNDWNQKKTMLKQLLAIGMKNVEYAKTIVMEMFNSMYRYGTCTVLKYSDKKQSIRELDAILPLLKTCSPITSTSVVNSLAIYNLYEVDDLQEWISANRRIYYELLPTARFLVKYLKKNRLFKDDIEPIAFVSTTGIFVLKSVTSAKLVHFHSDKMWQQTWFYIRHTVQQLQRNNKRRLKELNSTKSVIEAKC